VRAYAASATTRATSAACTTATRRGSSTSSSRSARQRRAAAVRERPAGARVHLTGHSGRTRASRAGCAGPRASAGCASHSTARRRRVGAPSLTSFVRNRLIDEVYLPLIGDNLAKQIGRGRARQAHRPDGPAAADLAAGLRQDDADGVRRDRLGLVFMKVNGPALGHEVRRSTRPRRRTPPARQEVEKINLALEMGNNVMLYVDDIQHTHPSSCRSSSRSATAAPHRGRVAGRTRTYDLRGKKFCVVMAGNPYTESGEKFRSPTCSPTAPTPTTSATSSAARRTRSR
jgi:hypothetical protein